MLKRIGEPVGVILGPHVYEDGLYCDLLYLHPGLVPGDYMLRNGLEVRVPSALCKQVEHRSVTLEVISGEDEQDEDEQG